MKIGLLLPHFGRHATTSRLVDGVAEIERLGFDSVWVRDHLVYRPHSFEDEDGTFVETFTALAAAAARTSRIMLGTATLIPHRHPILSALQIASLATYAGSDRLIIGWGVGNDEREFSAANVPGSKRGARLEEHVAVVRQLLSGRSVSHHGDHYQFDDVRIQSSGAAIPFWYGGGSLMGIERAARLFDGLLASRIPRPMLREHIEYLRRLSAEAGRKPPQVGVVTLVSPAETEALGLAAFDIESISADTARRFPDQRWAPNSGLDGVMIAGPPDHLAAELRAFEEIGVSHVVLDLRARFDQWEALVNGLARDVLPLIRRS